MPLTLLVDRIVPARVTLASSTVAALAGVLLSEATDRRRSVLLGLLREDAPFRTWAETVARCGERSADELLADWLASAALAAKLEASEPQLEGESDAVAEQLRALIARLARLDDLEHRFAETLEREKLAAMAEFAAGAGHEMNPPLAIISGRAQLFLRHETDPERRRELALINRQALRVHEMIADMMHFARPARPRFEPVDLAELLGNVVAGFEAQAAEQGIALRGAGWGEPLVVEADPTQLTVAVRAVVVNSLEALQAGGSIDVTLSGDAEWARIVVEDDGPGIAPEVRRHLFDPYFSGRGAGRGLGLGLSKCWRIVTAHGGRVDVDSSRNRGAGFTLTLPRQQATPADA